MIKEIKTKEEQQNKRVTKIIAALFVAGAAILIAAYVPDVFKKDADDVFNPPDLTDETTRLFIGEIATIDYEKKLFTLALYDPDLYEGFDAGELATSDEFSMSPWTITPFFAGEAPAIDENGEEIILPDITLIEKMTIEIQEGESPRALIEEISFDDLQIGNYVQVSFWSYGYSPLARSITPYAVSLTRNPFQGGE